MAAVLSAAPPGSELAYAVTWGYLASLMRFIDSSTFVTSDGLGNSVESCPVFTRPWESVESAILVGCAATLIIVGGDIELPPDTELSEPMRSSNAPRAPTCQMAYMGLCGLSLVSFCDSAGITAPVVFAIAEAPVRDFMPRRCALSE